MTRSWEVARSNGEVLEPLPDVWAHVLPAEQTGTLHVVVEHRTVPDAVPGPARSKAPAWGVLAVALAIAVFACYAAISSVGGPQLRPVHRHPVDLVGPHR